VKASTDQFRGGANDGETRLKFYAVKMQQDNTLEDNKMLLKRLKLYNDRENQMME
jgi:hypothetical protein